MNKTQISVEVVAHSISPQGDELLSVLCTFPRIILAEVNTHRMLSKNTSSSRAIPFNKMVETIQENPFVPIAWQKEHKGMQGSEYITQKDDIENCVSVWLKARDNAIKQAICLNGAEGFEPVTKQLCNRLLEPFMWTTMLITGSYKGGWDNFFKLRCPRYEYKDQIFKSKKEAIEYKESVDDPMTDLDWLQINKGQAEIHMMALAEAIYDARNESVPQQLEEGEYHIPFIDKISVDETPWREDRIKISVALAARTSYTVIGDEKEINYQKMIELHDKLINQVPVHSSPLEHVARAMSNEEYYEYFKGQCKDHTTYNGNGWCRNFKGFVQYRHIIENEI